MEVIVTAMVNADVSKRDIVAAFGVRQAVE